jgi:hypothetical protein
MTQQAPQAPQTPQAQPRTFGEILTACIKEAGVEDIDLSGIAKAVWYPGPWSNGCTEFKHNEKNPLNKGSLVFIIFEDAEEFRVYSLATLEPGRADKETSPPTCHHLQKRGPVYSAHSMTFPLFLEEVTDELRKQAFGDLDNAAADTDTIECPACGVEVPHLIHCGSCGAKLPAQDEEEETKDGTPTVASNVQGGLAQGTATATATAIS